MKLNAICIIKNKSDDDWLKRSKDCFYYQEGEKMTFSLMDRVTYHARQTRYWLIWRAKNVLSLKDVFCSKVFRAEGPLSNSIKV